jgi:hypothetical protein
MFDDVLRELGIEPCAVICLRHPAEVVQSLAKRKRDPINRQEAGLSWLRHTLDAERHTRHWRRAFVDYSRIVENWALAVELIGDKLGVDWPRGTTDATKDVTSIIEVKYRHHFASSLDFSWAGAPWYERTYAILSAYATGIEPDLTHSVELDEIAQAFANASRPFEQHIAALEAELRTTGNVKSATAMAFLAQLPQKSNKPTRRTWKSFLRLWPRMGQPERLDLIPHVRVAFANLVELLEKSEELAPRSEKDIKQLLRVFIGKWSFDEKFYLRTYPDVVAAVRSGQLTSAYDHFLDLGYLEGRLPIDPQVDEVWYLQTYPDVANAVNKHLTSARNHFIRNGYREGRLPSKLAQDWMRKN